MAGILVEPSRSGASIVLRPSHPGADGYFGGSSPGSVKLSLGPGRPVLIVMDIARCPDGFMDSYSELPDFSGTCRLFPLPNVILFPHVILPLHIFEPRYRQMTQDALDGDQLVTIVQACPADDTSPWVEPVPIAEVGCVGKIIRHERLADGRFNMLLLGCKRVRLVQELAGTKLYRTAEGRLLEDEVPADPGETHRAELIELFLEILQMNGRLDADLSRLLYSDLSLGVMSDIIAHALDLPAAVKQSLLEEIRVDRRISLLVSLLRSLIDQVPPGRRFPRPFSLN
jgi:Lon protease-like protein